MVQIFMEIAVLGALVNPNLCSAPLASVMKPPAVIMAYAMAPAGSGLRRPSAAPIARRLLISMLGSFRELLIKLTLPHKLVAISIARIVSPFRTPIAMARI